MNISNKKKNFLDSLKGDKLTYKRYSKQPLRYPGGKSLAVGEIISYIPSELSRVVSPFAGGVSVEYAIANELNLKVICFDIFDPLINFYNVLKKDKKELLSLLNVYELTEENYRFIKNRLKTSWEEGTENKIQYAADFFFNFGLSYGPGFLGWVSKKYLDKSNYFRMLKKIEDTNFKNMKFKTSSFEKVLPKYKNDFLYLDPPYYIGGTSKMFAGIYPQRNFPIYHNSFNHELMAKQLKKHKGGFLITYNDCEEIRELYKDYQIIKKKWQYTMGQGETRIGKNRLETINPSNIKQSHEIFILSKKEEKETTMSEIKEMNIKDVKTSFKIMQANLIVKEDKTRVKFNYLDEIRDEKGNLLDKKILTWNVSRVYIITVNDVIYKIGQSGANGGMKTTLKIYEDGGIKGRPSIRSYGVFWFILTELQKGNKVEFHMIYQEPISTKVKGLFKENDVKEVNISPKYMEEYCLMDYKSYTGKIPNWNLQEQGLDWPDIVKMQHAELLQESTKRPGRNKKKNK